MSDVEASAPNGELDQERLPTIYEYAALVYQTMEEKASDETLGAQYGDEEGLVYEGFLTKLIAELNLPNPYYTKVTNELKRMDCIRQLRRGGSTTPSRWLLLQPPTPELFRTMRSPTLVSTDWRSQMEQRINDLNNRVNALEVKSG